MIRSFYLIYFKRHKIRDPKNHNIVKINLYYEYDNTQDSLMVKEVVRIDFVYETENWKFAKMQHCNQESI